MTKEEREFYELCIHELRMIKQELHNLNVILINRELKGGE